MAIAAFFGPAVPSGGAQALIRIDMGNAGNHGHSNGPYLYGNAR